MAIDFVCMYYMSLCMSVFLYGNSHNLKYIYPIDLTLLHKIYVISGSVFLEEHPDFEFCAAISGLRIFGYSVNTLPLASFGYGKPKTGYIIIKSEFGFRP